MDRSFEAGLRFNYNSIYTKDFNFSVERNRSAFNRFSIVNPTVLAQKYTITITAIGP